jgi:hypothetical protein
VSKVRPKYVKKEEEEAQEKESGDGNANNTNYDLLLFDKKVSLAAEGLEPFFDKILRQTLEENAIIIAEYINTAKREINISNNYRKSSMYTLVELSRFHSNKKNFKEMTREDILLYLDSLRRPEGLDPLHKWIGTYNLKKTIIVRFFKWLYYPDIEPTRRPKPKVDHQKL